MSIRILERRAGGPRRMASLSRPTTKVEDALIRRRDLDALAWIGEQSAGRVDQLEHLMDCSPRTMQRTLARLRDAGLVSVRRVLAGEPAWVFPTSAGLTACGSSFGVWAPRIGLLSHVAAVSDVRLHIERRSAGSEWICERALARDHRQRTPPGRGRSGGRPARRDRGGADDQEPTAGDSDPRRELTARYDTVLYFCAPGPHRLLQEFAETGRWPTLGVRELPVRDDGRST